MASGEVIKSFLASLGFAVDEEGLKRFDATLAKLTSGAVKLGATLGTVAAEVELAVRKIASEFEDLYYASIRSGSTAQNLSKLGFAAGQIGLSADEAQGAVTGLYHALILNPGTQGLLQQLGVQVRDLDTSKIGDTSKLLVRLVEKLKEFGAPGSPGFAIAAQLAQAFGITADQLVLLERQLPELKQQMEDFARRSKEAGVNQDELASKSHKFMVAVRTLGSELELIATQAITPLLAPMTTMATKAEHLAESFAKWSASLHDIPSLLGGLAAAVGSAKIGGAILRWARGLFGGGAAAAAGGSATMNIPAMGAAAAGGLLPLLAGLGAGLGTFFYSSSLNKGEDEQVKEFLRKRGSPLGVRSNNPLNLMPGGKEAVYGSAYEGYVAGAHNLLTYASRGWDTIEQIVKHWAPAKAGNDTRAYEDDLSRRLGVGSQSHLNLYDPETLRRVMSAMTFHEQGMNPYSADLIGNAGRYALGGVPHQARPGSVTLNQKTDIHVSGGRDPNATGRAVASEQGRVNADAIRNLSGAMR